MNIVSVTELLAHPDYGLDAPKLNVLVADANNYSGLLLQPQARIEADQTGIRNRDRTQATAQFSGFLEKALNSRADLVVTPEYSTPWNVLREAINGADKGPASGKLWALGCESIRYSELKHFKDEISEHATVIFEEMPPDISRVVDPLAYVFRTSESQGIPGTAYVIQGFSPYFPVLFLINSPISYSSLSRHLFINILTMDFLRGLNRYFFLKT